MAKLAQLRKPLHAPESQTGRYCRIAIHRISENDVHDGPPSNGNPSESNQNNRPPLRNLNDQSFTAASPEKTSFRIERIYADSRVFSNGVGYCSLSEAALGALMETYIPCFRILDGENFQISIGNGRSVDFMVDGVLIEYHQPRLHPEHGKTGDYDSRDDYQFFLREIRRVGNNPWRKQRLIDETSKKLSVNYYARRLQSIRENPQFKNTELIVAASREEFYQKVIVRFCKGQPPTLGEFLTKFWWWVNTIAHQNGLPPVKKPQRNQAGQ